MIVHTACPQPAVPPQPGVIVLDSLDVVSSHLKSRCLRLFAPPQDEKPALIDMLSGRRVCSEGLTGSTALRRSADRATYQGLRCHPQAADQPMTPTVETRPKLELIHCSTKVCTAADSQDVKSSNAAYV
ncbi:hypothetical protein JDV02_003560 [Purpureocillium takamizusanense]|uniref:Uncharacterized protein n=1 Tax=Purpureocillium takamizusanense TaxID=2060973 RepID=A0A9Q8QDG3_9HYPO|nr:uncharacterized protein JDV02_003560 [Purpureocillium takamizusanense]UNI17186.1 hypothetical protein JDV02_003560 [Purpureocillium takamizusanense]